MKRILLAIFVSLFVAAGIYSVIQLRHYQIDTGIKIKVGEVKIQTLQTKLDNLNLQLDKATQSDQTNKAEISSLQAQKAKLEAQLQARAQINAAAQQAIGQPAVYAAADCGSDPNLAAIFQHESGCNPSSVNSIGCYGLGQDCNGIVRNQCGTNFSCQYSYFADYAMRRYGSSAAAWAFWQANHWW